MFSNIVFDIIIKTETSNYLSITFQVIPYFLHTLSSTPHSPSNTGPKLCPPSLQKAYNIHNNSAQQWKTATCNIQYTAVQLLHIR